ncbi:MAG: urease accessory protein UreE [Dongiaceae bacterium]
MLRLDSILGHATDADLAERLHHLEHDGKVEYILLAGEDTARRRLHVATDRGTDCAIMLPRAERLSNGAVLLLESDRAVVVRLKEAEWLTLQPRDAAVALELGYFAGNMHWPVRFDGASLKIALHGPAEDYLERLDHLLKDGRIRRSD